MNVEFLQALDDIEKDKGIPKKKLLDAIEAALVSAYKRNFGSSQNVIVTLESDTGEIHVYSKKEVVEEVEDEVMEISLEDAQEININKELGDFVEIEVTPANFGRIAAQTAKQVVIQRIREAEREIIFEEFQNREGDILTGIVQRRSGKNVIINLGRTEALLIPSEQMASDNYSNGQRIKVYVVEVKNTTKGAKILVSRTHPGLLTRLFELEVPEIYDGIVEIRAVAREAGARSKIGVQSHDPDVDPVGACVGPRGIRVQTVVDELNGEKIDIVEWNKEPSKFVANGLSPADVVSVNINEEAEVAQVIVPDYQLSLAIGKEGQNARLAAKLTGWKVDIKSQSQMDDEKFEISQKDKKSNSKKVAEKKVTDNEEAVDVDAVDFDDLGEPSDLE